MIQGDPDDRPRAGGPPSAAPGSDLRFSPRPNRAHEIAWRAWGDEAFDEARRAGKPVLLAISAVWCHWCHVMDETSYSDPEVQAAIAEGFVAVRVDNDRRPDVNRRYNMGGWPTIAFLTPAGEVLTGATYLPPDQLLTVLERVRQYYADHAGELAGPTTGGATTHAPGRPEAASTTALQPSAAAAVYNAVATLYDPLHGGLGVEPKFPQPDALGLLLAAAVRQGDARLLGMALHSLDAMAAGELHDAVEQGFFRYATRRDWSAPHYEKLLDDNARLALLYLDAFAFTGRALYAKVATGVIEYLTTVLRAPDAPVFFGSQDADEHYYRYDAAGRGRVAVKPAIDHTVFVDANALAARALLRAATLLDRPDLLESALAMTDDLWDRGHGRNAMVHYLGGPIDGLLADQAQMAAALLDAYEVSGDRAYLARARLLADWALERLRARDGRFTDRPQVTGTAPASPRDTPLAVLEEGAEMADDLTRLAAFSGVPTYREEAARALAASANAAAGGGALAASWALAVMRFTEHPTHIVVVGGRGDAQAGALRRAGLRIPEPLRSVQLLDPDADAETIVREGYSVKAGGSAAFVCLAGVCLAPTSDPARLPELVARSTRN
ncbi:MAG: thioredoxin domain-containing protein [Thermoleophilia bacterium]